MGWLDKIIGIEKPIDSVTNLIDKTFTSDEERLQHKEIIEKLRAASSELQSSQNQELVKSPFFLVQAARPFLMYLSGLNFAQVSIAIIWLDKPIPEWWAEATVTSFLGAMGIYGFLRTFEKITGRTR